jgi:hypothetical protein
MSWQGVRDMLIRLRVAVAAVFVATLAAPLSLGYALAAAPAAPHVLPRTLAVLPAVPYVVPTTPNAGPPAGTAPSPFASVGGCRDATSRFSALVLSGNLNSHGIFANLNPDTGFKRCSPGGIDKSGGSFAWVGIQDNTYPSNQAIIQIGVADCNDNSSLSFCVGYAQGSTHYFGWVGNACGNGDLQWNGGVADLNNHVYQISYSSSTGNWTAYVDGHLKFTISNADNRITCWVNRSTRQTAWAGETHDYGDGLGSSVFPDTHFSTIQYFNNSSWINVNDSSCSAGSPSGPHMFCDISGNSMSVWTVQ